MGATISIYLDTRIKKADNVYPLKLRATYLRERVYLGIKKELVNNVLNGSKLERFRFDGSGNYSIDKSIFEKTMNPKVTGILKDLQIVLKGIELDAQKVADSLSPFTFDAFKARLGKMRNAKNLVFLQFDTLVNELKAADRIGTAISYNNAATSLKAFTEGKDVPFEYFTKEKLEKYKTWMQSGEKPKSNTTIGIYLRALRRLYNRAIDEEITIHYPFGKGKDKMSVPKGKGRKIALNRAELQKIFDFELPEKHPYAFYLDMWKLLYLMGGPNPTDLCLMRESNIQNGFIYYVRAKTKRTTGEQKEIRFPYSAHIKQIVEKWKVVDREDSFLIPVVKDVSDSTRQKTVINQFVKMINTTMKQVAETLKIDQKITSYVARHSIATQLLRSGASVKFIGDQLGHQNTKTTEAYLNGFEDEQIREVFNQATKF